MIEELLNEIDRLKNQLNKDSSNSSKPPSTDTGKKDKSGANLYNSRKKTDKKIGGQVGHKKHKLEKFNDNEITEEVKHTIDTCPNCNSKNIKVTNIKVRDELDFKITIIKRRHYFYDYICEHCGNKFK